MAVAVLLPGISHGDGCAQPSLHAATAPLRPSSPVAFASPAHTARGVPTPEHAQTPTRPRGTARTCSVVIAAFAAPHDVHAAETATPLPRSPRSARGAPDVAGVRRGASPLSPLSPKSPQVSKFVGGDKYPRTWPPNGSSAMRRQASAHPRAPE